MFHDPRSAYEAARKASTSSRELEAQALFRAARQLEACRQQWEGDDLERRLEAALRYNQRLWTFFQAELGNPEHDMPREMRANLLRIIAFIDRRTLEVLADPAPAKLQALIDINRHVAAGLATPAPAPEGPR